MNNCRYYDVLSTSRTILSRFVFEVYESTSSALQRRTRVRTYALEPVRKVFKRKYMMRGMSIAFEVQSMQRLRLPEELKQWLLLKHHRHFATCILS